MLQNTQAGLATERLSMVLQLLLQKAGASLDGDTDVQPRPPSHRGLAAHVLIRSTIR